MKRATAGIPHGSIILPIVYFICSTEVLNCANSEIAQYACDTLNTTNYKNQRYVRTYLQRALSNLKVCSINCKVNINTDKSVALLFNY